MRRSTADCRDESMPAAPRTVGKSKLVIPGGQGKELFSQHHTIRVEARTLQHEVIDGFRGVSAPKAVRIWGKVQALEVTGER